LKISDVVNGYLAISNQLADAQRRARSNCACNHLLVADIMSSILFWHDSDVIDERLQFLVVEAEKEKY
jgi:hypothetical protein